MGEARRDLRFFLCTLAYLFERPCDEAILPFNLLGLKRYITAVIYIFYIFKDFHCRFDPEPTVKMIIIVGHVLNY